MLHKIKTKISLLLFAAACSVHSQNGNWGFVGPVSNNNLTGSEFETAQLNKIVIDPANPNHLFTGGPFGGLWECTSTDHINYNWQPVNTNPCGFNGVLGLAFQNSTTLIVGNYHMGYNPGTGGMDYSSGVCLYNFSTQTWSSLSPLPVSQTYLIKNVAILPNNPSVIFVCTSIGLFRSSNGGVTWAQPITNNYVENIVFVQKSNGTNYFCYAAGSKTIGLNWGEPVGAALVMESSDDGVTFPTDLSSMVTVGCNPTTYRQHCMACLGQQGSMSGQRDVFILSTQTPGTPQGWDPYGWDNYAGQLFLDKISKNINTLAVTSTALAPSCSTSFAGYGGTRMALGFDPYNNWVWFGSTYMNYYDLTTSTVSSYVAASFHSTGGGIHNDMHDIAVQSYGGQYEMYVAHDGGVVRTSLSTGTVPYFNRLNNGLNVCLTNGFSGSEDHPEIYAVGGGDIVNTDIYDANLQRNKYTQPTWENDGALIDKFNDQNIILDLSNYSCSYATSIDGGQTISGGTSFYNPAAGSTFALGAVEATQNGQGFTTRQYYQDPYRPGRIYYGKGWSYLNWGGTDHGVGLCQYDFSTRKFINKLIPCLLQPGGYVSGGGTWVTEGAPIRGMSFSPQTPNSFHCIVSASGWPYSSSPAIIKYIGNNFDDVWVGHNDAYNTSSPQWANVAPNFTTLSSMTNCGSCNNVTGTNLYGVDFKDIETSPWNKDVIYVSVYIPNNPGVIILKYDGTNWSNYSNGLPAGDYPFSMIMDHASNDGIYIGTDYGVYYRDASMSSWIPYNNNLPIMISKQLEINYKENTVRAGLAGRGIWKSSLSCPTLSTLNLTTPIAANFYEATNVTASSNATMLTKPTVLRGTNSVTLNPGFVATGTSTANTYLFAFIHGCSGGSTSSYQYYRTTYADALPKDIIEAAAELKETIRVYPNPNEGKFTVAFYNEEEEEERERHSGKEKEREASVYIYSLTGNKIFVKEGIKEDHITIDISAQPKGVYMLKCIADGKVSNVKVINE